MAPAVADRAHIKPRARRTRDSESRGGRRATSPSRGTFFLVSPRACPVVSCIWTRSRARGRVARGCGPRRRPALSSQRRRRRPSLAIYCCFASSGGGVGSGCKGCDQLVSAGAALLQFGCVLQNAMISVCLPPNRSWQAARKQAQATLESYFTRALQIRFTVCRHDHTGARSAACGYGGINAMKLALQRVAGGEAAPAFARLPEGAPGPPAVPRPASRR